MSIKRISGSDQNRQYYEITGVYTGKKHVVSVKKKDALKYEKRRNQYEAQYIDKNGNRSFICKNSKIGAMIGLPIGLISGFAFGKFWKKSPKEICLLTVFGGIFYGLLGSDIGDFHTYFKEINADHIERLEKWNGIEVPEKIKNFT